jgi:hypothetical protein
VKVEKPKTFNQLIEIIVKNVNRVAAVSEIKFLKRILIVVALGTIRNEYKTNNNNEKIWKKINNINGFNSRSE